MISFLFLLLAISPGTSTVIDKCCPSGKLLDIHRKVCVSSNHVHELSNWFEDGENLSYFVPSTANYKCDQSLRYNFDFNNEKIYEGKSGIFIWDSPRLNIYPSKDVCIDEGLNTKTGELSVVAQTCLPCSDTLCVNYCCPSGMINSGGECVKKQNVSTILTDVQHTQVNLQLHCNNPVSYPKELWSVSLEGEMKVDGEVRQLSEYCVEIQDQSEPTLLLCPKEVDTVDYKHVIKMVFMCLTMVSLLIIIIFHIVIKDLRLINFTKLKVPFLVFFFLSFFVIVLTSMVDFTGTKSCIIWAIALQYCSLSIFFWLTSMSLDIWLTFRRIANPIQNRKMKDAIQTYRMRRYYIFSLGTPAIISIVTCAMQLAYNPGETDLYPSIGVSCMIGQYLPRFIYFHAIIITLLIINAIFYCLMVFKFSCGIWKSDSFGKCQMRNFNIFIELVFVMGIHWISESVDFFVGWKFPDVWDHPLIVTLNSINWFSGVFILILFFSKSNNRNLVRSISCKDDDNLSYYDLAGTFSTQLSDKEETFKITKKIEKF